MRTPGYIVIAMCLVMLLGYGYLLVQVFPILVKTNDHAVQDGAMVTAQFHITPQNNLTTTYSETDQFIQGQHTTPPVIEQQVAGMHLGERKTFSLSAEEGFGPYDETKLQSIPTEQLPREAREGDIIEIINDNASKIATVVSILPEKAVLDLNHPLAGKPLNVMVEIVKIEDADKEVLRP
ncbi:MAG: FKBP-type peptidyl-prolyl cis-trans isomerase [Nitrospiraceae bacterium]